MKKRNFKLFGSDNKYLQKLYSGSLLGDQIKILKSRKIDNVDRTDTLAIRLKAGLSTCMELDGVRNHFDFISRESMPENRYIIK
jgi:hypothetical protein